MMRNLPYKVVIVGDAGVGKSTLRSLIVEKGGNEFPRSYMDSIGAEFIHLRTMINENEVNFNIIELTSKRRFEKVQSVHYMGAIGAIVLFDLTRQETIENLPDWLDKVWKKAKKIIPVAILGNKSDLRVKEASFENTGSLFQFFRTGSEAKPIIYELSEKTRTHGFDLYYRELSVKNGFNIREIFQYIYNHYPFPFYCQICQQNKNHGINRLQCDKCNRLVCEECYNEILEAGLDRCPMCEGSLVKR